ncbi:DUF3833 domain-containing protein [Desulfosediminicola flagellatus]|uniref:DUF3833 domain-containing protein n=1 Tax=Desulfosediminicola flagellatus TaxID=2569541 RepID=UPI0010ACB761|nr:DUF3833 domain-containing protein [Desulfosediminicola flagellatus]
MKFFLSIITVFLLTGCSTVDVRDYRDNVPAFNIFEYFQGGTTGWGIVQDRKGKLLRQFVVKIDGNISESGELILDEDFVWSDGEIQKRIWTISSDGEHILSGTADDVVGKASGESYGNALNWKYYLDVKVDDSTYTLYLDDWMFLQPDNILINKTAMSKFGFHVGDITIVFNKTKQ